MVFNTRHIDGFNNFENTQGSNQHLKTPSVEESLGATGRQILDLIADVNDNNTAALAAEASTIMTAGETRMVIDDPWNRLGKFIFIAQPIAVENIFDFLIPDCIITTTALQVILPTSNTTSISTANSSWKYNRRQIKKHRRKIIWYGATTAQTRTRGQI